MYVYLDGSIILDLDITGVLCNVICIKMDRLDVRELCSSSGESSSSTSDDDGLINRECIILQLLVKFPFQILSRFINIDILSVMILFSFRFSHNTEEGRRSENSLF